MNGVSLFARARSLLTSAAGALFLATAAAGSASGQQEATDLERAVSALEWREMGPTIMGGRVADLAVVESDPSTFYVGTATGGVWKTTNHGVTFESIFDDQATSSIGDVTVAPSNPNVVWVGTGEPQNRQSSPWGNGVHRSTDGGRTWAHLGLEDTHHIARIQVHPRDPDVAYVAAVGHLWGPNPERGIYRTTDGGETWEKVLYTDDDTGAIDLIMDPNDPETLFAALYQRRRTAWGFNGGGPGSGIHRTTDGGDTWTKLSGGLPDGDLGRIGLDIYRGDSNQVFAIVEADKRRPGQGFGGGNQRGRKTGVYRSHDRGETWVQTSTTNNRPMYYSQIRVDPNDPERIYLGGAALYRSVDGGKTFTPDAASGVHLDHHALWIDPADSEHLILAGDGGVSISWDRSDNWIQLTNLPLAQFYEIGVDMQDPYHVCGGLQDNGSWCAPNDTRSNQGIRTRDWYNVGSGDGFFTVHHPTNHDLMFAESQGGNVTMFNRATRERSRLRPVARPLADAPDAPDEQGEDEQADEERTLRWNWNTPVVLSAHDASTVYVGSNVVFRSRDMGWTWEEISPDLTLAIDREELEIMGVQGSEPMMSRNDGISSYGNLTALSESPLDAEVLYAGTDDGLVHVTRDGGSTWTDVTDRMPGVPERTYVTRVLASAHSAGRVYAALDGHRNDDFAAYVYVSDDFGQSWRSITAGLPATSVNALAEHFRDPELLFLGNEVGVYFSVDAGGSWSSLAANMPTVPVDDIEIHPRENDLVLGTHGRGVWILDDITPLEQLDADVLASGLHVFPVRTATSYNLYTPQGWTPGVWVAPNPEAGARIRYFVGDAGVAMTSDDNGDHDNGDNGQAAQEASEDTDKVRITILDGSGETVRELEGTAEPGVQTVMWDLRIEPPYEREEGQGGGGFFGAPRGPRVLPGTYTVRVERGEERQETTVAVRLDPRVRISDADLQARQAAMMSAHELSGPVYEAGQAIDRLNEQLEEAKTLAEEAEASEALLEEIGAFQEDLESLEEEMDDARAPSAGQIESSTTRPTADQLWQLEEAWEKVPPLIERLNGYISERMPALYRSMDEQGVRPDPGEAVRLPRRGG